MYRSDVKTTFFFLAIVIAAAFSTTSARVIRRERNDGIHLAVSPRCGSLSGNTSDVNAGLEPSKFKTIVAFGVRYTDGGRSDGGPLPPAILYPPDTEAGGRSTNGLTWIENVANDIGANLMDYAQSAACIDLSLWPSNPRKVDFLGQMKTFLNQSNNLDPTTTLYTIFFGINDYLASLRDGDHMQAAAHTLINQISILSKPPTNARSFMVLDDYGRGQVARQGESFKQTIFSALHKFHSGIYEETPTPELNVAYVDFSTIWDGVLGSKPGFKAFGYTSTDACNGMCSDPEHSFYWIPGHPSKQTMRIMADYVNEVLAECRVPSITLQASALA